MMATMEFGLLFDDSLRREGAWLPYGPAPEWVVAVRKLEQLADENAGNSNLAALKESVAAVRAKIDDVGAKVRVRFIDHETMVRIMTHPERTRKISLALACVTSWEGMTSGGEPLAFNAKNLRMAALSNDGFVEFACRVCRDLPVLTQWGSMEIKKN